MRETRHVRNSAQQDGSLLNGDKVASMDFSWVGKISDIGLELRAF